MLTVSAMFVIGTLGGDEPSGKERDGSNQTDGSAAADGIRGDVRDGGGAAVARRYPAGGTAAERVARSGSASGATVAGGEPGADVRLPGGGWIARTQARVRVSITGDAGDVGAVGSAVSVNAEGGYWALGRMPAVQGNSVVQPRGDESAGDGWWALGRMYVPAAVPDNGERVALAQAVGLPASREVGAGEAAASSPSASDGAVALGMEATDAVTAFQAGYRSVSSDEATLQHMLTVVAPCEWTGGLEAPWYPDNGYLSVFQFHPDSWQRAGGGDPTDLFQVGGNVARWIAAIGVVQAGTSSGWPHCWWR